MADPGEQAADFSVASLVEHHFEFRSRTGLLLELDSFGSCHAFREVNALGESAERLWRRGTCDMDLVSLFNSIARVGQAVGQFPVIGYQDQAFTGLVQPANGKQAVLAPNQIDDSHATVWIAIG